MTRRPVKSSAPRSATQTSQASRPITSRGPPKGPNGSSKAAGKVEDAVDSIDIASLTIDTPFQPFRPRKHEPKEPPKRFLFLTLPSEIRLQIYEYYFDDTEDVLDLSPDNYKRYHKRLGIIRVCKQMHAEINHYFYSTHIFRIFPTCPGRYFKSKKPILSRLKPIQRECITCLELRLGPGWDAPPRGWIVTEALGLEQCVNVHKINVMVQIDPSDNTVKQFSRNGGFYEAFCRDLLLGVLEKLPAVRVIEFDAYTSVKKKGGMMKTLLDVAEQSKLTIEWGPQRGWTDAVDDETEKPLEPLAQFITGMALAEYSTSNLVAAASG